MSENDKLQREAERCWLEGIRIVNRGVEQMQRAYALREKAWANEIGKKEEKGTMQWRNIK